MASEGFRVGGRVNSTQHGTGFVLRIEQHRMTVLLDGGKEITVAEGSDQFEPNPFQMGDRVVDSSGRHGLVIEAGDSARRPESVVGWFDGSTSTLAEVALRPAEIDDPVERFKSGKIESPDQFNLRSAAADLWIRNRGDDYISLAHARFDLMPHQVGVLHRVMTNSPHRFLLSDEVGLGKTIEAGMILKELRSRGLSERVLVLAPANLQNQWQYELKTKFNETFSIFNRATIEALQDGTGDAANPWTDRRYNLVIASHQFASYSEERRKQIASADWDLIIVDEAHHARRQRKGSRVEQTNLYRLVRDLTSGPGFHRRAVLFLTATPMQLQNHELFSLVELLDYSLFASEDDFNHHVQSRSELTRLIAEIEESRPEGTALANYYEYYRNSALFRGDWEDDSSVPEDYDDLIDRLRRSLKLNEVMLRNRRASIGGFMPRVANQWPVQLTPQEELAQKEMQAIIREGYRRAQSLQGREASAIGFVMVIFEKLAASSTQALRVSLERRRQRLLSGDITDNAMWITSEETNSLLAAGDETDSLLEDDDLVTDAIEHVGSAVEHEAERLGNVVELLDQISVDSKAIVLRDRLRILREEEPDAKVVIFTEFLETQNMLRNLLAEDGWQCEVFHGKLTAMEKDEAITDFRDAQDPVVLVSTEAGGEGRNLQFAHILVNYDLPWNPMKVEQRIGRLDRIGQDRAILIFNVLIQGTIEERILEMLGHRIGLFKDAVGGLGPILGTIESDIRKAMQQGEAERLAVIDRIGASAAQEIERARKADEQFGELFAETEAYQAGIRGLIGKAQSPSVGQDRIDALMQKLVESVGGSVTRAGDGKRFPEGQRKVILSARFATEARDLFPPFQLEFDACFDSRLLVDSAHVEYLGFGHQIIERLVRITIEQSHEGKATIRRLSPDAIPGIRSGWQFNWRLTLEGSNRREWLVPIFVDDSLQPDSELARALLEYSQSFQEASITASEPPPVAETLDDTSRIVNEIIRDTIGTMEGEHREKAYADYAESRSRIERFYEAKISGAERKLRSAQETLHGMESDGSQQQVLPIWRANVQRGQDLLERLPIERDRELENLARSREPSISRQLLNVARIEVDSQIELQEGPDGYLLKRRGIDYSKLGTLKDKIKPGTPPFDIRKFRDDRENGLGPGTELRD